MAVRQYVGARYVPLFGRKDEESIEWDNTKPYEPLTIVLYQGDSFTSRQYVPAGIDITNQEFWALTGNYNAQIEAYREEVLTYDARISENSSAIEELEQNLNAEIEELEQDLSAETENRENADTEINNRINGIEENGWVTTERIEDESVTAEKLNPDVMQGIENTLNDFQEEMENTLSDFRDKIEAITIVQCNWIDSDYQTSYWGYKIPKDLFKLNIANNNGTQIYSIMQNNVMEFMQAHPNAILGHNCDFGSSAGTRQTRLNGVNYNTSEEPHYYPLLAVNTNTNEMEMYPSHTDIVNIPERFNYAFSVSHQLIENGVPNVDFPTYTTYDWNNTPAPRLGVGYDDDYFYGLFCEGRGKCERGLTCPEFAALFARVWHPINAYNLDGGGSIYMVTNVPNTTKINHHKDFDKKFNELRDTMLCWYYTVKED